MVEKKRKKTGKRWADILAVFLAVCIGVTGIPFGELQVKAEGEQEGLAENEYVIHYDPNDGAGVKVGEDTLSDGVVYGFSKDETLTFALTQPEFWQDATPIVEIIIHSETEVIYRSDANEGDEHKINLTSGNTFEFTPGSETPFEVIIWWSEYDAFWGTEEKPVIVELDCTGNGTVNIEDIADTDKITYGNLTKVRIAENVNTLTLSWEGEAPREIRVENGSTYGELSEKTEETITLQITEEQFCRVEIDFNRGSAPALENNQYIVHYDPNGRAGVKVGENSLSDGVTYEFSTSDTLAFALTQPEFWPNATPIVEIIVHSEPEVIYRSDANEEDGYKIDLKDDNTFVFTPGSETPFEVNIWWSEYDTFWGTEEKPVIVELDCTGNGTVNIEGIADTDKIAYGNLTKVRIAENVNTLTLSWEGEAPREIRVENGSTYGELSEKTQETITLQITEEQFCRVEIDFHGGNGDNPGPEESQDLKSYIESQQFAFGDWDENGIVNENDIKLGMAYQIYYPKLNNNRALQEEYGINQYSDLLSKITVNPDSTKNLTATDAAGVRRTIPAYTYTVTLTKGTGEEAQTITATRTAYAFSFADDSKYKQNNRGCVIAVTEKAGVKSYFLRCANAYTTGTKPDTTLMVSGGNPGEAPIVVVSDFDVNYNEQKKTYDRKVSIFGNGASLDHLLSQEEDTDVVAYQGRNEDFMRDIKKEESWGSIFSIFTFCQESFEGVQVQGSGASGSTPSWAYNQYPIFSTDDVETTEKEAVVYFGNTNVTIRPVDNLTGVDTSVTGIASVELADTSIPTGPTGAVNIVRQSDTEWKVTFHSDFYDQVKVKIDYTLQGGGRKTSYLNIHRVGIDILAGDGINGGMTLFHGTDNGPTYYSNAAGKLVIWGTYYYPQTVGDSELVDLYVTYTWPDGSITKKTIPNSALLNMAPANGNCQSSDFILYEGAYAGAPTKIEAIAVVKGFDNTTTFSGAKFGAGKGVVWNNYLGN